MFTTFIFMFSLLCFVSLTPDLMVFIATGAVRLSSVSTLSDVIIGIYDSFTVPLSMMGKPINIPVPPKKAEDVSSS